MKTCADVLRVPQEEIKNEAVEKVCNNTIVHVSGGYRFWGGGGARMVGVAGGGVGFWPDMKSGGGGGGGGGGGVLSVYGPIRGAGGGGGGGCCRILAQNEERGGGGGGGGVLSVSGPIRRAGGGGGEYGRVSGGPGYSTVVEFMRADINRQRNRAAIL